MRSATSVGANYREANEKLSKKDFLHRIKISRKECKETTYWIELIINNNQQLAKKIESLLNESIELRKILSTIIDKSK
ncbi:MAG: four helix bundle protein [Candidatus Magasanikbacteria bacterium]